MSVCLFVSILPGSLLFVFFAFFFAVQAFLHRFHAVNLALLRNPNISCSSTPSDKLPQQTPLLGDRSESMVYMDQLNHHAQLLSPILQQLLDFLFLQRLEVSVLFHSLDTNSDGIVTHMEFKQGIQQLLQHYFKVCQEYTERESKKDSVAGSTTPALSKKLEEEETEEDILRHAQLLEYESLRELTDADLDILISLLDKNNDQSISYEEFFQSFALAAELDNIRNHPSIVVAAEEVSVNSMKRSFQETQEQKEEEKEPLNGSATSSDKQEGTINPRKRSRRI